jgi:hypothetical protein
MPAIIAATDRLVAQGVFSRPPLFELDNAQWHSLDVFPPPEGFNEPKPNDRHVRVWKRIGIPVSRLIKHPNNSPDMNRCVENVHPILKGAFRKALRRDPTIDTKEGYRKLFMDIAEGRINPWVEGPNPPHVVSQASVAKNFEGLPEVWQWVYDNDGQKPGKKLAH